MSVGGRLPKPVRTAGRHMYVAIGTRTANRRATPDLLLIGAQRCGTTSLFRALSEHPRCVRPLVNKGINYFDLNYERGPDWYAGHFPLRSTLRRKHPAHDQPVVFEASGYYVWHPVAIERITRDLPNVKLVVMLRDPVERAFSAWKHATARGLDDQDFPTALALEDQRLDGEVERMLADPGYESHAHRHQAYRRRGDYVTQLTAIVDRLPREQLHVMYSESFFAAPETEFTRLLDFLGKQPVPGISFGQHNARPSASMPADARIMLENHFAPQAPALAELVGVPPPWTRTAPTDTEHT